MRLRNEMRGQLVGVAGFLLLAACDSQVPQDVVGTLSNGSEPAARVEVHLHLAETCDGPAEHTTTDESGGFSFKTESTSGGIGVVTQSLTLCINDPSGQKMLWSSTHGGGASRITLKCNLTGRERKACSDVFRYGDKDA